MEVVILEGLDATDSGLHIPFHVPAAVEHDQLARQALAHAAHVLDVAIVLIPKAGIAALAEPHLEAMHPRRNPLLGFLHHPADILVVGVARRDGRKLLVNGPAKQLNDGHTKELALDVPQRDVDGRDRVAGDAAVVAVPPHLVAEGMPDGDVVERVPADHARGHAFDDGLDREVRLRELGDRFTPAHDAVVGRDLDEAEMAQRVEVVGLRIADRDSLDGLDLAHEGWLLSTFRRGRDRCRARW